MLALGLTVGAVWWLAPPPEVPAYAADWAVEGVPCAGPCEGPLTASFSVVLRPAAPPGAPVAARVYLVGAQATRRYAAVLDAAPDGVVRFEGRPRELFPGLEPGAYTLVVAVGRSRYLPLDAAELAALQARPDGHVALAQRALVLRPE